MIEIEESTGCLMKWKNPEFGEVNFIGSGCEFSDWFSFFSHERLGGLDISVRKIGMSASDKGFTSKWDIKTKKGSFSVEVDFQEKSMNVLFQRVIIVAKQTVPVSWLGDAVVRFVLPTEAGMMAVVENCSAEHTASNTMRETEARSVSLQWPDGRSLNFKWAEGFPRHPIAMTPYLYIRDQAASPQEKHKHSSMPSWILHGRLLTEMPSAFVFRFSRNPGVLWDLQEIQKRLFQRLSLYNYWRAREFQTHKRLQTQGLWAFRAGERVELAVELEAVCP